MLAIEIAICVLLIIGATNALMLHDVLVQLKPTVKALGSDPVAAFPTKVTK